jgi:hypothetical protein
MKHSIAFIPRSVLLLNSHSPVSRLPFLPYFSATDSELLSSTLETGNGAFDSGLVVLNSFPFATDHLVFQGFQRTATLLTPYLTVLENSRVLTRFSNI